MNDMTTKKTSQRKSGETKPQDDHMTGGGETTPQDSHMTGGGEVTTKDSHMTGDDAG
ncbi:hypothetical protein HCK00_04920 [Streptomyces sp. PLAI1-29]|uniref:Sigma-like protein n=2 Tax=Streptomyces zingiberis TaxID=2053010 RepID=A0ABX1BUJ6_9ACTN|nr:hypothetical protein [Streptomyces zingiberis]